MTVTAGGAATNQNNKALLKEILTAKRSNIKTQSEEAKASMKTHLATGVTLYIECDSVDPGCSCTFVVEPIGKPTAWLCYACMLRASWINFSLQLYDPSRV